MEPEDRLADVRFRSRRAFFAGIATAIAVFVAIWFGVM